MGPTGVGVLYMRREWLERLEPPSTGGGMVRAMRDGVSEFEFEDGPMKFEAGTPDLAGIAGLGAALEYLQGVGRKRIARWEESLLHYTEKKLREIDGISILGKPARRAGAVSFTALPLQAYDVAVLLDTQGIAVRSGTHCAIPLHRRLGIQGSVRISPAFYNNAEEIDALASALQRAMESAKKAGLPVGNGSHG